MTRILLRSREKVLTDMAHNIYGAATNPLVNMEIQRRLDNVPASLMELFFMQPDAVQILDWHVRNPYERFSWVGTMLRYRVPGTTITVGTNLELIINYAGRVTITVEHPFPNTGTAQKNWWSSMDDFCLLIGVCFYIAVLQNGGADLFEDPEELHATLS
jgi:hypothetical protein